MFGATGAFVYPSRGQLRLNGIHSSVSPLLLGARLVRPTINHTIIKGIPCDDETVWSGSTGLTIAADSDNYVCGGSNSKSVKFTLIDTSTSYGSAEYDFGSNQDWRDADTNAPCIKMRVYTHDSAAWDDFASIRLYCRSNGSWSHYYQGNFLLPSMQYAGWHTVIFPPGAWSEVGTPSWETIDLVRFRVNMDNNTSNPVVTLDQIEVVNRPSRACYAFTFDDGGDDFYDSASYLTSKGMRGTFYIIADQIGESGYLTLDQLHSMHDAGHLIANHSWSHLYRVEDGTSDVEYIEEITKCAEWLCANGFGDGARLYSMPGGTSQIQRRDFYELLGRYPNLYPCE